ncbi:MAG: spinster family MFS transporter [Pseudomonadota bacterium]
MDADTSVRGTGSAAAAGKAPAPLAAPGGLAATAAREAPSQGWYLVFVMTVCYTLSFIDRQILSLLVGPIKADLGISDTQVGLLGGLAFSLFYTLMALPLGRIVDRSNRRNLVVAGVAFWSAMTAACALARGYGELFLARMGVGLGEAVLNPAAASMIADSFPREKLSSALSVYSMGIYIGAGSALLVGGAVIQAVATTPTVVLPLVGEIASWRATFLIVGLPGLLVALWVWTLREPSRRGAIVAADGAHAHLDIAATVRELRRRAASLIAISGGQMAFAVALYAFMLWAPVYFQRVHAWSPGDAGTRLGLVVLVFGCAGMYAGGRIADRWFRQGQRDAALRLGAWGGAIGCAAYGAAGFFEASPWLQLALFAPGVFALAMPAGSCYAALQLVLPNQVRGQAIAIYLFVANLGGLTLGPLLPGVLNDYAFASEAAVGTSLAITLAISTLAAGLIFGLGRRGYRRDYAAAHPEG